MNRPKTFVSIIFRALNEEKWFEAALDACKAQKIEDAGIEIILVDSGSTDRTLEIAERHGCRVIHIKRSEFTFGRSLNYGCDAAAGDILTFISAHCIPAHERWLANLISPIRQGAADYVYGKQIGHELTRFSEHQVFAKYFSDFDKIPQGDFFCNNANAAIRKELWAKHRFDEAVTGLEDMVLAKSIVREGGKIGYVADAPVIHIHEETLEQVKRRYYREALTLREIMPEVHFNFGDFMRYLSAAIMHDFSEALSRKVFFKEAAGILGFRIMQYWGTYRGHNEHRTLSRAQKERYYYPRPKRHVDHKRSTTETRTLALANGRDKAQ
ncbi:glycosyltransferase [Amphiplicatus metriothermophilus]|uniref:Glycosyl transferase family 2 n=1 Tax=Amphiplicatus metriothermophilus TaxID=1519374 RepID=A0A239Q049_9PROT|nr:glycosyltransferase family 2 protein [Amphiplicatus metriothermophilus]MBB5520087.1 glycosyltransferase involved in cell wall biosynthesis [Amphiplicatus metriothermophilus]SNT75894.1 Glycosyl transferase family 2 [Amphiplicatus metriothermophilus]